MPAVVVAERGYGVAKKDSAFAARLRELREGAKLTQEQLAEAAGMNRFGIAKLEQGVTAPSWATVQSLARALGVSTAAFEEPASGTAIPPKRGRPPKAAEGVEEPAVRRIGKKR